MIITEKTPFLSSGKEARRGKARQGRERQGKARPAKAKARQRREGKSRESREGKVKEGKRKALNRVTYFHFQIQCIALVELKGRDSDNQCQYWRAKWFH